MDDNPYGFASPDDKPIPYMERIRTYYTTLGYGKPYEWAHHSETPFTPLKKPVSESRVALITTAAPYHTLSVGRADREVKQLRASNQENLLTIQNLEAEIERLKMTLREK